MSDEKKTTRSKEVLSFLDQLDTDLKTPGAAIAVSQDEHHEPEQHPESQHMEEPQSASTDEAEKTIAYLQNLALKKSSTSSPRLDDGNKTPTNTGSPVMDKGKQREEASDAAVEKSSGWGSWFSAAQSQAQAALAQAKVVAEQTAASNQININPAAAAPEWKNKLGGFVKGAGLDKIAHELAMQGKHALSEVYNAVVPPITDTEELEVWVSHDMVGYDGIADVVYSGLAKVS